jgi:hypothetical protein
MNETDHTMFKSVLGGLTGLLMIALLAAPGASYAQQASSPNSVMIEMSPKGDVLKVTKADGTPILKVERPRQRPHFCAKAGGKQFVLQRCMYCVQGDGCWQIC